MPSDDFRAGYEAAMAECQARIRQAERDRRITLELCARVHAYAKMLADMTKPGTDLAQYERMAEPVRIEVSREAIEALKRRSDAE